MTVKSKSEWEENTVVINEGWTAYCLLCDWREGDFATGRGANLVAKEHWDAQHASEIEKEGEQ